LESVGHLSLNSRLPVGLLTEVSSLVSRHGAELWQQWKVFADELYLAEPPRQYLPDGHVFESPPFSLEALRKTGHALIIEILRENMRHSGAIKIAGINHWLSPLMAARESTVDAAALVEQPLDELLGIIALESMRNSCMIVADPCALAELQGKPNSAPP